MKLDDNHRLQPALPGAYGPPDGPEDTVVFRCPCGVLYAPGGYWVAHEFKGCDG